MDTVNSRRVVWFLLGSSLISLAVTGAEIYSRMAYLWGFLLIINWAWARLSLRGLVVSRRPKVKRAHIGQIYEERFEVNNTTRMPRLWVEVRDESVLPGARGSHVVTMISGRQRRYYHARSRLTQRGVFSLGPTVFASGDPFGLFPVSQTVPVEDNLLVYPLMVDIQSFPNPPGLLTGGEALNRRTHNVTPNASGVREYAPGDSLNRIHWPTTVRRDKLMVKDFELDPQADIWFYVDAEFSVHSGLPYQAADLSAGVFLHEKLDDIRLPPTTEEYAASVAASLARFYLRRRRAVGLLTSGDSISLLPPDRGGRQLNKVLEALALYRADGDLPMSGVLESQAQHITRGSTIVLITPTVRPKLALSMDFLSRRGLRPIAVLLDAESFGDPPGSRELAMQLKATTIPVRLIANGVDIEEALITEVV
jgi:uncharacterized protein (DUF58 family)